MAEATHMERTAGHRNHHAHRTDLEPPVEGSDAISVSLHLDRPSLTAGTHRSAGEHWYKTVQRHAPREAHRKVCGGIEASAKERAGSKGGAIKPRVQGLL